MTLTIHKCAPLIRKLRKQASGIMHAAVATQLKSRYGYTLAQKTRIAYSAVTIGQSISLQKCNDYQEHSGRDGEYSIPIFLSLPEKCDSVTKGQERLVSRIHSTPLASTHCITGWMTVRDFFSTEKVETKYSLPSFLATSLKKLSQKNGQRSEIVLVSESKVSSRSESRLKLQRNMFYREIEYFIFHCRYFL